MKRYLLFILFALLIPYYIFGASNINAPEWMNITVGARANALGKQFAAFSDDATTLFNNPAGQPHLFPEDSSFNTAWLSATYGYLPGERHFSAISTSVNLGKVILGVGGIYTNGINNLDSGFNPADNERDYAYMPVVSLAGFLGDMEQFSIGGNIKFFSEKADGVQSTGMAFDIGGYVQLMGTITVGFVMKNLGYIKYSGQSVRLIAPTVSAGIGYNPAGRRNFGFCLHIEKETGSSSSKFVGSGGLFMAIFSQETSVSSSSASETALLQSLETSRRRRQSESYFNVIYLNLGFYGQKVFSCGLTFNIFTFKIDYAFVLTAESNIKYSHYVTLEKRF